MEVQVESTNTTAEQSSEEMTQLVQEAEDLRAKNTELSKLLENERTQY